MSKKLTVRYILLILLIGIYLTIQLLLKNTWIPPQMSNLGPDINEVFYIGKWTDVSREISVYSAYWDNRLNNTPGKVVIIGMRRGNNKEKIRCLTYNPKSSAQQSVADAKFTYLPEGHGQRSYGILLTCQTSGIRPSKVALNIDNSKEFRWLNVSGELKQDESLLKDNFAVCVRPFNNNYNNTLQLAEFVAFYETLGVDHFTFYDYQSSQNIKIFIESLSRANYSVELIPWYLPKEHKNTWEQGQTANIQDCVYRHLYKFKYVVIVDLDEYIVPKIRQKLIDIIKSIQNDEIYGSYVFQSTFFCLEYPIPAEGDRYPLQLLTQKKFVREAKIWKHGSRSKYIVRPTTFDSCGIHSVWNHLDSFKEYKVPKDIALVNHYRAGICNISANVWTFDNSAKKYNKDLLNSRAIAVWKSGS